MVFVIMIIIKMVIIGATGSGTLFVEGGGTVMTKTLAPGEEIVVSSDTIVGFQQGVELGLRLTGG